MAIAAPVNLSEFEALARQRLDDQAWAYLAGGAADELTLTDNLQAWQRLRLAPRVLRPLAGGHTRSMLLGRPLPFPVLLAPVAYQRLFHPDGEVASALAAAMQGTGYVLSAQASTRLEDIAALLKPEPTRGPLWFQLYLQADRGFTLELVQRAEAAGFEALVLTVDAPTHGARDRERRAGFRLPPGVSAVNLAGAPPAPAPPLPPGCSALFDGLLQHAATWDDVAWLQDRTRLPLLLKGVLHPDDARQAAALGLAGLIVSNHGGRTLDTAPATADALPRIADALAAPGGEPPALLVDGGIRRGTDVLKALALGARAVLVGRPVAMALAAGGAQGVALALRLLRDELEIAMALSGCRTLDEIGPAALWRG
ncbi:MAG: alpha-hydroxy-acid oxidizing protein [Burkholderiaceae bacterium]|nr:alpha-hydroxy-acid oxidizing protein [Burkholderiaceae bacterium]